MNWIHCVSVPWLKARKDVLTASDVVRLAPEWKRVKAKKQNAADILPMFAALWCEKNTTTEPDPISVGAAARGHFMEPYAVQTYNGYIKKRTHPPRRMYHWDDCIIKNNGLGFSPDACSVKQMAEGVECIVNASQDELIFSGKKKHILPAPKEIVEIKSYSPGQHMKSILKDKMEHEELMQIAVAFAVLPKLQKASLMFYCPDAPYPVRIFEYTRKDLKDQIEMAVEISELYAAQSLKMENLDIEYIRPVCSDAEVYRLEMTEDLGTRIR